jgi:hypothetical protein
MPAPMIVIFFFIILDYCLKTCCYQLGARARICKDMDIFLNTTNYLLKF